MAYQVKISRAAEKFLDRLDLKTCARILQATLDLSENPRPSGCVKLEGSQSDYRIRIGDYRVIYQIQDAVLVVLIIRIGHRKDIYR